MKMLLIQNEVKHKNKLKYKETLKMDKQMLKVDKKGQLQDAHDQQIRSAAALRQRANWEAFQQIRSMREQLEDQL